MIHQFHVAGFWAVASWLAFYTVRWFVRARGARLEEHREKWILERAMRLTKNQARKQAREGGYELCPRCGIWPIESGEYVREGFVPSMCERCGI